MARKPATAAIARQWAARARAKFDFSKAAHWESEAQRLADAAADTWRNRADLA